jgi:hypothetical protein
MKKAVFWDVAPCRYGVNRRFGGTYRLHLQGRREIIRKSAREASVRDVRGRRGFESRLGGYFSQFTLSFQPHYGPGIDSGSNKVSARNLPGGGGKGWPARKADKLTAICEPIVWRKCGSLDVSEPCGPSRPVTGIVLPFT